MGFRESASVPDIQSGDQVFVYATRSIMRNPSRDQSQILGYGTIVAAPVRKAKVIGNYCYPVTCRFDLAVKFPLRYGVPFAPLVPDLAFIRNKAAWAAYMRRTVVRVPSSDAKRLVAACDRHSGNGESQQ
jgi:hypothetical protein